MNKSLGPWRLSIGGPALLAVAIAVVVSQVLWSEQPPGAAWKGALVGLGVGLFLFLPLAWIRRPVFVHRTVTRTLAASWFLALVIVAAFLSLGANGPLFVAAFLWLFAGADLSCALDLRPHPAACTGKPEGRAKVTG